MLKTTFNIIKEKGQPTNLNNREYWLEKTLKTITPKSKILDAGAGEQQYKNFCSHLEYISQDFAKYDGKGDDSAFQTGQFNYENINLICDIIDIPAPNQSFDAIMCIEVLEHLPNPDLAIKEFARIIKKDGVLIITAPFCSLTHFSPYHYFTGFNKYWYEYQLKKFGFDILEIASNGNYFSYLSQEINRVPEISVKYADHHLNKMEKLIIKMARKLLMNINKEDRGSNELLCFGYHILSKKIK